MSGFLRMFEGFVNSGISDEVFYLAFFVFCREPWTRDQKNPLIRPQFHVFLPTDWIIVINLNPT